MINNDKEFFNDYIKYIKNINEDNYKPHFDINDFSSSENYVNFEIAKYLIDNLQNKEISIDIIAAILSLYNKLDIKEHYYELNKFEKEKTSYFMKIFKDFLIKNGVEI